MLLLEGMEGFGRWWAERWKPSEAWRFSTWFTVTCCNSFSSAVPSVLEGHPALGDFCVVFTVSHGQPDAVSWECFCTLLLTESLGQTPRCCGSSLWTMATRTCRNTTDCWYELTQWSLTGAEMDRPQTRGWFPLMTLPPGWRDDVRRTWRPITNCKTQVKQLTLSMLIPQ